MVEIVICVHNALEYLKNCLESISINTIIEHNIILIDDCSEKETEVYLKSYCTQNNVSLTRNEIRLGYTKSVNIALKSSSSEYVVLLNSDTIVTKNWIEKMLNLYKREHKLALVGPLSNAASFQSILTVYDTDFSYSINSIPSGFSVESFSTFCERNSLRRFPEVPFLNGFCMMLRTSIIKDIGVFDEYCFPDGYGEEIDFCLRVRLYGYSIRVADDTYVYHHKSKSYGGEMRNILAKEGRAALYKKYGQTKIDAVYKLIRENEDLKINRLYLTHLLDAN